MKELQRTIIDKLSKFTLDDRFYEFADIHSNLKIASIRLNKFESDLTILKENVIYFGNKVKNHEILSEDDASDEISLLYEKIEELESRKKYLTENVKLDFKKIPPLLKNIFDSINDINELSEDFIDEMRQNALNIPKGNRLNAYAVDCCNFIDAHYDANEILYSISRSSLVENESYLVSVLKSLGSIAYNAYHKFNIGTVRDIFEDYFPNTQTVERKRRELYDYDFSLDNLSEVEDSSNSDEKQKGLSAPQQLLFIKLLQECGLFPKRQKNTDESPELKAIALITGLNFLNDIKGGKGKSANIKAKEFLDPNDRKSFKPGQITHKLNDLDKVEHVARLLNLEPVLITIEMIRTDIKKLYDS